MKKLLMNIKTGSIDTEENWLADKAQFEKEYPGYDFGFDFLVEVNSKGEEV